MRFSVLIMMAFGVMTVTSTAVLAADAESLPGSGSEKGAVATHCLRDLQEFNEMLAKAGFGVLPPEGYGTSAPMGYYGWGVEGTPRQKIHSLRDAAYVYAYDGDESSCRRILSSMREVYEQHQGILGVEADNPEVRRAWRRAHLERTKPATQMNHLMRAEVLISSEIRNLKDEKLGEIEDLVLNPEKRDVLYVLVSHGGFLGFGEKLVAIPWSDLRVTEDHELYVLDVPPNALDAPPQVDRRDFAKLANADWQRSLSAYWDGVVER